ncbi:hypothetical protein M3589_05990 [Heyndrickxia oleronia]|jgi:predicted DNA-binding transcriptional regulator YafY|uniref:WYL domain-containing protein n=1 Tax=Heyndrickxia oleronia TaxID=38875 RepID=A0AAW6SNU4_9BACI|nr:hypothetical protein [Heyndrickxia oleronia]MCM3237279.1 hypothetical protein [Heyndrickxia oleronia]MDH5160480.1 hypothetical protein [Heyndrickxia oleronia]
MKGLLHKASTAGERLEMIYLSNEGEITQRIIKVKKVGEDYFRAYCYTRNQIRTFSMSNILSIGPVRKHHKHLRKGA